MPIRTTVAHRLENQIPMARLTQVATTCLSALIAMPLPPLPLHCGGLLGLTVPHGYVLRVIPVGEASPKAGLEVSKFVERYLR